MSDGPITLDLEAFRQAHIERLCQLAAASLLVYEYVITWSDEVDLFWKKRWSFGKCIFLWVKFCHAVVTSVWDLMWETRLYSCKIMLHLNYVIIPALSEEFYLPLSLGDRFFHWQNTGASLQVATTHIILELRLYAMYGSSRIILAVFIAMTLTEAAIMGVFVGVPVPGLRGTNNPATGLFICADGDPIGRHWVAFYWTSLLSIESILLGLSIYKAWQYHKTGQGGNIMRLLTRDSVLYFIFIFGIYLGNQIIWLINDITLNEVGTGFSFCISAILANRLLFAVRSSYFKPVEQYGPGTGGVSTVWPSTVPTYRVKAQLARMSIGPPIRSFTSYTPDIELTTFDERRGF